MNVKQRVTGSMISSEPAPGGGMSKEERQKQMDLKLAEHQALFPEHIRALATRLSADLTRGQINELFRIGRANPDGGRNSTTMTLTAKRLAIKPEELEQAISCLIDRRRKFGG
ncbi:hypothetical protein B7Z17_04420 [Candidatus Saccharibacteria bacterium 32-49-10]|nr:MAG: hypothetical protein B7Z17_04420 [Candidatus Saccharibacteria bacterium 32-49-10]